jgi:hypothetical protein
MQTPLGYRKPGDGKNCPSLATACVAMPYMYLGETYGNVQGFRGMAYGESDFFGISVT